MMEGLMTYSAMTTKVRAMRAKLLKSQDYDHIAGLTSVQEVTEYLAGKPAYASVLSAFTGQAVHREQVERLLYQSLYDDYTRLFRFGGLNQKSFLKTYWKRYEVDLINDCLRIVLNHYHKPFDLDYKKEIFDRYSQISIDKLITSRDIQEFVENLAGTEYYELLKKVLDSGNAKLIDYDLALDLYYFTNLWKKDRKLLKGDDLAIFTRDYGTRIDLLNMQWIYRAKRYYQMEPAQIYAMTIPIHYKLKVPEFKQLVEAKDLDEFEKLFEEGYYFKRYSELAEGKKLEQAYHDILGYLFTTDMRKHPYSFATLNTYLFLKEQEIDKLITALECIRYGLPKNETLDYIGGRVP